MATSNPGGNAANTTNSLSKGAAAAKFLREAIADSVGPMAVLAIGAGAFVKASAGAALNAQKMAQALKASDGAERMRVQFENLLGSSAAAKRQIEMLAKVASGSAFSFDSLADASKNLQVLTNGALNSEKALRKVQDVAAATGAPVDTMATAVADLHNALKSGDGVEAASGQLKNMGAISNETAQNISALSASGVGLATTWQIVEADLNRANGAASALGGTLSGLQQQLANIQQGSDTKIGEMFAEGEKAGLRAAIGFKKFTSAVEEANAGPWAALLGAINSIKEAVGRALGAFAELGAVKAIFQALSVAAIAVLGGINLTIIALVVQLGKLTVGLLSTRAAVAALGAAAKGFAGLWSGATIGLTAFVAVLATMIALGSRAASSVKEIRDQIKDFSTTSQKGTEKAMGMALTASSPEERDAADSYLEEQITNTRGSIEQGKKNLGQAREDKKSWDPYRSKAGGVNEILAQSQISTGESTLTGLIALQDTLNDRARDNGITAFDQKRLEMAQKRADLEKDIADRARERVQASAMPEVAAKMAGSQKENAVKELKYAEEATKNRKQDDKGLDKANKDFQKSKQERDSGSEEYNAAVARNEELEKSKEIVGIGAGAKEVDVTDARHSGNSEYIKNKEIIAKGATKVGEGLDYSVLDEAGKNSVSESGKLQAEMAKREAMKQERQDAIGKGDMVRRGKVEAEMAALANPLTGKSEFEKDAKMQSLQGELATAQSDFAAGRGGQDKVNELQGRIGEYAADSMGSSGQRLQTELRTASGREDTVAKTAALEGADVNFQQAREAKAADDAANEAGERKLNIQKQLAALANIEGGDGDLAAVELGPEIEHLSEKLKAVQELKDAEDAYANASKADQDNKDLGLGAKVDTARANAKAAGAKDGETVNSVRQEVQGVKQVLEIRRQQAAIEQAAAQRRRTEAMAELNVMRQITQMRISEAKGKDPTKTENNIAREERDRKRKDLVKADGLIAAREGIRSGADPAAALAAAGVTLDGVEGKGAADVLAELDRSIAGLGFDKSAKPQDSKTAIDKLNNEEASALAQEAEGRRASGRDQRIQMLKNVEEYAPNNEVKDRAEKERKDLEDERFREEKAQEYRKKGFDSPKAAQMAADDTLAARLRDDLDQQGRPAVDAMTAAGGGSGFLGLIPDQDKAKVLENLAQKNQETLQEILKTNNAALAYAQKLNGTN